jgi:hypothetical protein
MSLLDISMPGNAIIMSTVVVIVVLILSMSGVFKKKA